MDYTLIEINKHKNNISNLSTKLLNTFHINEEIFFNSEIKKETEILTSLFNIKMNQLELNNKQLQQQYQMMIFQMQQQMQMQEEQNLQNQIKPIHIYFKVSGYSKHKPPIMIECMPNDKVADAIQKYRSISLDTDMTKKFIFNAHVLNPSLTLAEAGFLEGANVFVVITKNIQGG